MIKLSVNLRQEIVKMFQTRKNQSNYSRALNIGRTTVRKVWLKFQETGSVSDKKDLVDQRYYQKGRHVC